MMHDTTTLTTLTSVQRSRPRETPCYFPCCGTREPARTADGYPVTWPITCRCGAVYASLADLATEPEET